MKSYRMQQDMEQAEGAMEAIANINSAYYQRLKENGLPEGLCELLTIEYAREILNIALQRGRYAATRSDE